MRHNWSSVSANNSNNNFKRSTSFPMFITQNSMVPRPQLKRSDDRSLCRDQNAWNLPAKHAKHTKRICVHLRASAVKKSFAQLNLCSPPNDPATRHRSAFDCNLVAMAEFAGA